MCWSVVKMSIEFSVRNHKKPDQLRIVILTQFSFLTRTGSKLGISPLMLAAMNGHVPAVKLLLDMGSDINAQIETNRNTALTLACFQGRAEVVSLLLDRKANVEHRAKARSLGLTTSCLLQVCWSNVWGFFSPCRLVLLLWWKRPQVVMQRWVECC